MNRIVTIAATALIAAASLAQETAPEQSKAFVNARREAGALVAQKDYARAEAAYRKILKDFPDEHGFWKAACQTEIGIAVQYSGDTKKARDEYSKVKDIPEATATQKARAQLQIGTCHRIEGKPDEAIAAWESMPGQSPDAEGRLLNILVNADLAVADQLASGKKDLAGAYVRLESIPTKYHKLQPVHYGRLTSAKAGLRAKQGAFAEAVSLMEQAAQIDPAEQYARCMIAVANYSTPGAANMPDKARAALAGVLAAYPTNATLAHVETALTMAQTYFRAKEYTASLVPFLRAHAQALQAADGSLIPRMFERIDPTLMSAAEYTGLLEHLLLAVKSTKENARFLGVVGSELNKMK